jgi:hypothetical protein
VYIQLQTQVPPGSPVERLVRILDLLCAAIAARGAGGVLTKPLFFLLWGRLRRTAVRAIKLAARITAGVAPPAARPRRATPRPPRPPTLCLPRRFAWVMLAVPGTAALASQLQYLLAEPELARLAEDPAMRRLLNPLCQMLGIPKPPPSPPPPRPAAAAPTPAAAAPAPSAVDRTREETPAGGTPRSPPAPAAA